MAVTWGPASAATSAGEPKPETSRPESIARTSSMSASPVPAIPGSPSPPCNAVGPGAGDGCGSARGSALAVAVAAKQRIRGPETFAVVVVASEASFAFEGLFLWEACGAVKSSIAPFAAKFKDEPVSTCFMLLSDKPRLVTPRPRSAGSQRRKQANATVTICSTEPLRPRSIEACRELDVALPCIPPPPPPTPIDTESFVGARPCLEQSSTYRWCNSPASSRSQCSHRADVSSRSRPKKVLPFDRLLLSSLS
mmetsp:Transcript_135942/g.236205  ORF Transcript_135942/g.236205 Transcript_135942/m.236205 type:complete len:252 (+) Transcript_135942:275-1030(+)